MAPVGGPNKLHSFSVASSYNYSEHQISQYQESHVVTFVIVIVTDAGECSPASLKKCLSSQTSGRLHLWLVSFALTMLWVQSAFPLFH
jgi:hypothetical protein